MIEYIKFWGAKVLFEVSLFFGILVVIFIVLVIAHHYIAIKQRLCKHSHAYRNNSFLGYRRYSHRCPDCGLEFDKEDK
jgi:hypothetical protein